MTATAGMDTPVLLCVFNRPRQAQASLERLRAVRPAKLYIAADGPRSGHPTDAERCAEVRRVVSEVDWPCDLHTLLRDSNVGCRLAVGGAISWLFEHEEEGIILEDDIIADPSFFPYCAELLERYRNDKRVGIISGCNFTAGRATSEDSYIFVRNLNMWGWATWRRVWQLVDLDMSDWNAHRNVDFLRKYYDAPWATRQEWARHFDNTVNRRRLDVWDYQVCYALWRRGMLAIDPSVNLIDNDGIGADATHPSSEKPRCLLESPPHPIQFPLRHPANVALHPTADAILDRDVFGISPRRSGRIAIKMQLRKVRHFFTGRYV
jgi:hypothetical protein